VGGAVGGVALCGQAFLGAAGSFAGAGHRALGALDVRARPSSRRRLTSRSAAAISFARARSCALASAADSAFARVGGLRRCRRCRCGLPVGRSRARCAGARRAAELARGGVRSSTRVSRQPPASRAPRLPAAAGSDHALDQVRSDVVMAGRQHRRGFAAKVVEDLAKLRRCRAVLRARRRLQAP
jgi:hypothetical protein